MENTYMKTIETLKNKAQSLSDVATNNVYLNSLFLKTYNTEMTEIQKKVVFYAISSLKNNHRDLTAEELANTKITLKISTFLQLLDLTNSNKYAEILCKDVEKLMKSPIVFKNELGFKKLIGWFDSVLYIPKHAYNKAGLQTINQFKADRGAGNLLDHNDEILDSNYSYISFQFTKSMSELLLNLADTVGYTKYNFMISHSLKSKHSIRIYELLQTRKDTNVIYMNLDEFYNALAVKDSYKRNQSDFKKRVLDVAKEELNEKFNLGFDYEVDKKAKKVTLIAKKNDNDLCKEIFDTESYRAYKAKEAKTENTIKNKKELEETGSLKHDVFL